MVSNRGLYGAILAAVIVAMAVPCCADIIPQAEFGGQVIFGSGPSCCLNPNGPGTFTINVDAADFIMATLLYQDGEASISGNGSETPNTVSQITDLHITFFFAAFGSISESVPLIFTASGSTSQTGSNSTANATFVSPGGTLSACSMGSAEGQCAPGVPTSFSSTLFANATPGTIYQIEVAIGGSTVLGGAWAASVDPQVEINPSFADASDFTLQFSPNPTSSVPEPHSRSAAKNLVTIEATCRTPFDAGRPKWKSQYTFFIAEVVRIQNV
jgi:hypothetical protein